MKREIRIFASALALSATLIACGGNSSRETLQGTQINPNLGGNTQTGGNGGNGGNGGTGQTPWPWPSPTAPGGGTSNLPALSYSFSLTGPGGKQDSYTTPMISTDSILRVKVIAGPAGQLAAPNVKYSNFSSTYGCVSYTVSAIGMSKVTKSLSVGYSQGGVCPPGMDHEIIDFSGRLTPGHGPIQIKVSQPRYSFYCELLQMGWVYGTYSMFCPMHTVYRNHTVTGSLEVQVNGTSF